MRYAVFNAVMVIGINATILIGSSCRSAPTCPKLPIAATPAAEIRVTPSRLPCLLPALPRPVMLVGIPDTETPSRIYVTKTDLGNLAGYLIGLRSWVQAASVCLEAK